MARKSDRLIGTKVGMWTVLKRDPEKHPGGVYYICKCECGTEKAVVAHALVKGTSWHCGCQKDKVRKKAVKKNAERRLAGEYKKKPVDIVGQRYGRLLVLEQLDEGFATKSRFRCRCDCGNEVIKSYQVLKAGTKSCGCISREKRQNLSGRRFGSLTTIRYIEPKDIEKAVPEGQRRKNSDGGYLGLWECRCDCGNIRFARASVLTDGEIKSCGCKNAREDLTGQRFGRLVALREIPFDDPFYERFKKPKNIYWECRCDCGNLTNATVSMLKNGLKISCGCYYLDKAKPTMEIAHIMKGDIDGTNLISIRNALDGKVSKANRSGIGGVYQKTNGKYGAQIGFKGKRYFLGTFDTLDDAACARKQAEEYFYKGFLERYESELKSDFESGVEEKREAALKALRDYCRGEHEKSDMQEAAQMKVKLDTIIDGLECVSDETQVYYDTESGETVLWMEYGDNDIDEEELEEGWDSGRLIPLPDKFEINEYHMMEAFAYDRSDEHPELVRAIKGRGAFRRFKDTAMDVGAIDDWYEFRDNCYKSRAEDWCRSHDLEWVE